MASNQNRCTCGASTQSGKPTQLGNADLKQMSPQEIHDAYDSGRFDDLLSGRHSEGETSK